MCDDCTYPGELAQQEPDDWDDRLEDTREPGEPDWDAIAEQQHCDEEHDGGPCNCPIPTQEQIAARWEEQDRKHRAEAHGGRACDCDDEPPF